MFALKGSEDVSSEDGWTTHSSEKEASHQWRKQHLAPFSGCQDAPLFLTYIYESSWGSLMNCLVLLSLSVPPPSLWFPVPRRPAREGDLKSWKPAIFGGCWMCFQTGCGDSGQVISESLFLFSGASEQEKKNSGNRTGRSKMEREMLRLPKMSKRSRLNIQFKGWFNHLHTEGIYPWNRSWDHL